MCELQTHQKHYKQDPTKTITLRKKYEADLVRRFKKVRRAIIEEVVKRDAFGLKTNRGRFEFESDALKVESFMAWLDQLVAQEVLGVATGTPVAAAASNSWANVYVQASYAAGLNRAASQMRKGGASVAESFVGAAFARPIHADRVGILYSRNFRNLDAITKTMDAQISSVLAQGIAQGDNPQTIARALANRVDKVGITRARTLARTEVINAHAEATLNGFEEAGLQEVEVEAEWATANDDRVCEKCAPMNGRVFKMQKARGMIPLHPNCRCAWLPVVKGGTGIELK